MDKHLVITLTLAVLFLIVVNVVLWCRMAYFKKVSIALKKVYEEHKCEFEYEVEKRTLTLNIALKELELANHALAKKSKTDKLTGLHNRSSYDDTIKAEFRRSTRTLAPFSIVMVDIDHFKMVNDTFGHLAGDQCLVWLSSLIKKTIKRESDVAFRYGGEEFCVILPITDAKGAFTLAEKLRSIIEASHFEFENKQIDITVSCGVFTFTQQPGVGPEKIFLYADKALYQAKNTGRNKTIAYNDL